MTQAKTLRLLAAVAEEQWGLVTRRQAEENGVSTATVQRLSDQGVLRRVAQGVYLIAGAPSPEFVELRAAWLQLSPEIPAWKRTLGAGVVSYRSAAALYGLGHLPADQHEFTLPARRQSRRPDVRLHKRLLAESEVEWLGGLLVTRPARIAKDLLAELEDSESVAQIVVDAMRDGHETPDTIAAALSGSGSRFGFQVDDGPAVLRWLVELTHDEQVARQVRELDAG